MFRDIISDIACKMVSSRETNCKKHAISVDFNFSFVFYYLCPPFPPSYIRYNLKNIFTFNSISIMNLTYQCKRAAILTANFIFRVTKNNAKNIHIFTTISSESSCLTYFPLLNQQSCVKCVRLCQWRKQLSCFFATHFFFLSSLVKGNDIDNSVIC